MLGVSGAVTGRKYEWKAIFDGRLPALMSRWAGAADGVYSGSSGGSDGAFEVTGRKYELKFMLVRRLPTVKYGPLRC